MCKWSIYTSLLRKKGSERMVYEIAGLKVEMEPKYDRLLRQSVSYRSEGNPVMKVVPDSYDEMRVVMEQPSEGEREYICCGAAFCRGILNHGRFFLHASAVVHEGEAYLFAAPSGTGKSTHTALWRTLFPESYILNDDKPVLWPQKGWITVFGTPFSGKTDLQVNREVPLKGICFLHRGEENEIWPVSGERALALMLEHTWLPQSAEEMEKLLDLMEGTVGQVRCFEMSCNMEPEAAKLSCRVMKGM